MWDGPMMCLFDQTIYKRVSKERTKDGTKYALGATGHSVMGSAYQWEREGARINLEAQEDPRRSAVENDICFREDGRRAVL